MFLPAGTVHALGGDIVVFEGQQNSDVTFRLYDWDHVDAKTGRQRALQVDQALACIEFADTSAGLVATAVEGNTPVERERLFRCEQFGLWRLRRCPIVHRRRGCATGAGGHRRHRAGGPRRIRICRRKGDAYLLPAVLGACTFRPRGTVYVLGIGIPE